MAKATAKPERQDRRLAIEKATQLFWQKGFHATSMRNLQDVIDMRPGSIYASFGSKEGLFKETLQHYTNASLAQLDACAGTAPPLQALQTFIRSVVLGHRGDAPSDMCMLAKTVAELTQDNAELLVEAKRLLAKIEAAFADLLAQAQASGALAKRHQPQRLARILQMQLLGMRAYARANNCSEQVINEMVDDAFACLH